MDIQALDETVTMSTNIGSSSQGGTVGSDAVPYPIRYKLKPITIVMVSALWGTEWSSASQKRANLEQALQEYPANKQARIDEGRQ